MVVHLVEDLACEVVVPKPWGARWGLGGEEGMVPEVGAPVEVVEGQGEGHNLEEGDLEAEAPVVVDRTDQGKEQGEEVCRHD